MPLIGPVVSARTGIVRGVLGDYDRWQCYSTFHIHGISSSHRRSAARLATFVEPEVLGESLHKVIVSCRHEFSLPPDDLHALVDLDECHHRIKIWPYVLSVSELKHVFFREDRDLFDELETSGLEFVDKDCLSGSDHSQDERV